MTKKFDLFVLIVFCLVLSSNAEKESCSIQTKQIPRNEPVYLLQKSNGHLEFYEPTGNNLEISSSDRLILFCPGNRNTLVNSKSNANELSCSNDFRSKLHQSNCTKQVTGDLRTTTQRCKLNNRHGLVYKAGFDVDNKFVDLFDICYDTTSASAIYTHHRINGKAIKYRIHESRRVNFKIDGVPKPAKAEVNYRKQSQINHFKTKLGQQQHYFTNTSFLSRGHLTPDADFIFSSSQFATYFYANVCPQFQTINGGNWVRVETLTRQLAEQAETDLNVYTGLYRQLALPSSRGDLVNLYLSNTEQIEVPEFIWKVVHNPRTHAAIVFITSNNPFAKRADIREICQDVCQQAGIVFSQTARRGFTYCCSYDDFSRTISPASLKVDRLLTLRK